MLCSLDCRRKTVQEPFLVAGRVPPTDMQGITRGRIAYRNDICGQKKYGEGRCLYPSPRQNFFAVVALYGSLKKSLSNSGADSTAIIFL